MPTRKVEFVALTDEDGERSGEAGWKVLVDGTEVIPEADDTDIAWAGFDPLWEALGIEITFDED